MIDINNLTISIGDRKLVENLSFSVGDGDKLAIIGEEGNGKSTLVKAIACPEKLKSYAHISGVINLYGQSVGYLEQILSPDWNDQEIYRYFLKDEPLDADDYENFNLFDVVNKYVSEFKLRSDILDSEQKIGSLSGGEKVKLQLIKVMMKNPDVLILDEPTNDLDIDTLEWLEKFITNCKKPVIFISHDEKLLENTANSILHIEQIKKKTQCKTTYCHLSYQDYVVKRQNDINKQTQVALNERAEDAMQMEKWRQIYNKVDHDINTISRKDPHGAKLLKKKMKAVKSQERRFERERQNFTDIPDQEEAIYLNFGEGSIPNGKVVCDINVPELKVNNKTLAKSISLKVNGPERVVIIGKNGVGKTTFIKQVYGNLTNRDDLKIGYMPQNYNDFFDNYKTVLQFVNENVYDKEELTKIRTFLACLKFTKEEVSGDINSLSGGQKAKLYIAKMMSSNCNVLVLDEPTRNLSPLSNPAIRDALDMFDGAIISVSHDRKFIEEIADVVYELTQNGLIDRTNDFILEN